MIDLLLTHIRQYVTLSKEEEAQIETMITVRSFKKGQYFSTAGQVSRYTHFMITGTARAFYIDPNGDEHVLQLGVRNWWIGDFTSFTTQQPGLLYTEALTEVTLLAFSYQNLQQLYKQVPAMERYFRLVVQNAYAAFQQRVLTSLSSDAEERYERFQQRYPEIDQVIAQKHIASYLGMSAEFLSKIKKRQVQRQRGAVASEQLLA